MLQYILDDMTPLGSVFHYNNGLFGDSKSRNIMQIWCHINREALSPFLAEIPPPPPPTLFEGDHLMGPQIDPATKGTRVRHKGVVCSRASCSGSTE